MTRLSRNTREILPEYIQIYEVFNCIRVYYQWINQKAKLMSKKC